MIYLEENKTVNMLTVHIVVTGWVHKSHERQMFNFVTFEVFLHLHQQLQIRILQIQFEIMREIQHFL